MLELISSGLLSQWLETSGFPTASEVTQGVTQPLLWPAIKVALTDPLASQATLAPYLQGLEGEGQSLENQGVWLQSGLLLLDQHQGTLPQPAASLTKVVTTLGALDRWGPDHQFDTLVAATGPIRNGVVLGDLVIQAGGDPFFVWEEAIALGNALQQLGIRQVQGNLVVAGGWVMNFETDPLKAGQLLRQGIQADAWSNEAVVAYQGMPAGTPRPQVAIAGDVRRGRPQRGFLLIRHRSLPMVDLLKKMNTYSNNVMAEMLAIQLGGAPRLAQRAADLSQVPWDEIQLINGSGLGHGNQLSPRAVCSLLVTIQRQLQGQGLSLGDVFPVAGTDQGTLEDRTMPAGSTVKTGTLWDVSALAGVVPTRDRGLLWFAILNRGEDLDRFRRGQDQLLQNLQRQFGQPTLPPLAIAPTRPAEPPGNPQRNTPPATPKN